MTPKEKAEELVSKMQSNLFSDGHYDAKQCALIAVDEIIKSLDDVLHPNPFNQYWAKVKQEIKNL